MLTSLSLTYLKRLNLKAREKWGEHMGDHFGRSSLQSGEPHTPRLPNVRALLARILEQGQVFLACTLEQGQVFLARILE